MEMSLPECAAQLGAAMLTIRQTVELMYTMRVAAFFLGLGIGIILCSLGYEWKYRAAIAWQRTWDKPLLRETELGERERWRGRVKAVSDNINSWVTKWTW